MQVKPKALTGQIPAQAQVEVKFLVNSYCALGQTLPAITFEVKSFCASPFLLHARSNPH